MPNIRSLVLPLPLLVLPFPFAGGVVELIFDMADTLASSVSAIAFLSARLPDAAIEALVRLPHRLMLAPLLPTRSICVHIHKHVHIYVHMYIHIHTYIYI